MPADYDKEEEMDEMALEALFEDVFFIGLLIFIYHTDYTHLDHAALEALFEDVFFMGQTRACWVKLVCDLQCSPY
jgi:hypothetical protein